MNNISSRVKQIRKLKQRSLHDCAKLLGISKEKYHQFEEGEASISLPEIELLTSFFEIPPEIIFQDSSLDTGQHSILEDNTKPTFINLRNKMIGAQLSIERQNCGMSLEDLENKTNIPVDLLIMYEDGNTSIPTNDLFLICHHLEIPLKSLLFQPQSVDMDADQTVEETEPKLQNQKQVENGDNNQDDVYQQLLQGIKNIPEKDQADIAKIILQKLKL